MPDLQRVHRFRDYAVAGVNWRPTRFVDEVPSSRVCGLCRMIPKRVLVLSCGHVLCQPCHRASSQGGRCPLDQEPFEEAECWVHDFPLRKAKTLKVHCWNEEHGCEFVGAIEDMLKHNETECDYHAVECLRCGEKVLHRELSTHYVAGCTAAVSPAATENPSPESDALTLQDVIASLEEVKTLLRDPHYDELLPEVQSKTNEPAERLANQGSPMTATRGVGESARIAKSMVSKVTATTPSNASQEPASRRNPTEQTSTSSSSLSCSEKPIVPQKLDFFTNLPADVLENMRKTSSRDYRQYAVNRERKTSSRGYPQYAVTGCGPTNVKCHLSSPMLPSTLTSDCTWRAVRGDILYQLAIENIVQHMFSREESANFAKITVLHTKDAYSKVEVFKDPYFLYVQIDFYGMLEGSLFLAPSLSVTAYDRYHKCIGELYSFQEPCCCKHDDSLLHFHCTFRKLLDTTESSEFFLNGTLWFHIRFSFIGEEETRSDDSAEEDEYID